MTRNKINNVRKLMALPIQLKDKLKEDIAKGFYKHMNDAMVSMVRVYTAQYRDNIAGAPPSRIAQYKQADKEHTVLGMPSKLLEYVKMLFIGTADTNKPYRNFTDMIMAFVADYYSIKLVVM